MPQDAQINNATNIRRVGDLWISDPDGVNVLHVPLRVVDESQDVTHASVRLYEGGAVWEDTPYGMGFDLRTTVPVRRATLV